ncbi:hypothetical protein L615_000100001620 [Nocardioides sp. J9]|nr:hypothetical protein L615_000100001620 [Nocardioides sp. J9]
MDERLPGVEWSCLGTAPAPQEAFVSHATHADAALTPRARLRLARLVRRSGLAASSCGRALRRLVADREEVGGSLPRRGSRVASALMNPCAWSTSCWPRWASAPSCYSSASSTRRGGLDALGRGGGDDGRGVEADLAGEPDRGVAGRPLRDPATLDRVVTRVEQLAVPCRPLDRGGDRQGADLRGGDRERHRTGARGRQHGRPVTWSWSTSSCSGSRRPILSTPAEGPGPGRRRAPPRRSPPRRCQGRRP